MRKTEAPGDLPPGALGAEGGVLPTGPSMRLRTLVCLPLALRLRWQRSVSVSPRCRVGRGRDRSGRARGEHPGRQEPQGYSGLPSASGQLGARFLDFAVRCSSSFLLPEVMFSLGIVHIQLGISRPFNQVA